MGWLFSQNYTRRRDIIENRIREWDTRSHLKKEDEFYYIITCLKHCYRGNSFSGTLWTVRETKKYDRYTDRLVSTDLWIGCDLLRYDNKDKCWGYKDMEESSGPNYYSCPLSYLDMVPIPDEEWSERWREDVRKYHAERKPSFKVKKDSYILLKERYKIRVFKIISTRPLRGEIDFHRQYSIPRKALLREITKEELAQAVIEKRTFIMENRPKSTVELSEIGDDAILCFNDF